MVAWQRIISDVKDFIVKDNFGLHLLSCYALATIINVWYVVVIAVLVEIFDKKVLKTKFSWKDILADLIGIILGLCVMSLK